MATWAKIKIWYKIILGITGSSLTATSTDSGIDFNVNNIFNFREIDFWKAANTITPMYITLDCGSDKTADYLAIIGHNLNTIGATITLQYSNDDFTGDINDAFVGEAPIADTVYLKEFPTKTDRYWRLKITGVLTDVPFLAICVWGEGTELDLASTAFDPTSGKIIANVSKSGGGYITGIQEKFRERKMDVNFDDADDTLYGKILDLHRNHGLKNFFIAYDLNNKPDDIFLMMKQAELDAPYNENGIGRNITLNLTGREEIING